MLTRASVEKSLRVRVSRPDVNLKLQNLTANAGEVNLTGSPTVIVIDPLDGLLSTLIHELIHVEFNERLAEWGFFQEPFVLTMEDCIVRYINKSDARLRWWRRKIEKLLEEE